jgi:hypothetical protein
MEKVYSRINKNRLLHTISKKIDLDKNRSDITDPSLPLQVSRVNLKSSKVKAHSHKPKLFLKKKIEQNECWIVLKGTINVSLFDIDKTNIKNTTLGKGSILITRGGGHSINKSSTDSELIEIKLGPYNGNDLDYY